jgi:hypothetical protein
MALHQKLPIYQQCYALLKLAGDVQLHMPRYLKQSLGTKIHNECIEILVLIGRANAARGMARAPHIREIVERLEVATLLLRLGARLNPGKTTLQPVDRGIDFVGHIIKPWRRTTRPRTVATALSRLASMQAEDVYAAGNSYLGLVRQASHSHVDQARVANVLRGRGHVVAGNLNKIYRKAS